MGRSPHVLCLAFATAIACAPTSGARALFSGATAWEWFLVAPRQTGAGAAPDTAQQYRTRMSPVPLGINSPPCHWVRSWGNNPDGPIYILVHGIGGDNEEWHSIIPTLETTSPDAMFMFRWHELGRRDSLAESLAIGVSRIVQCMQGQGRTVVFAHSAGGVLASLAASRIIAHGDHTEPDVRVITVASPLAGLGKHEADRDGSSNTTFLFALGTNIIEYPPPAPGIVGAHLRTQAPADEVMNPSIGGHLPNRLAVGIPGATQFNLPVNLRHSDAVVYAAHELAAGRLTDWFDEDQASASRAREKSSLALERPRVCRLREEILSAGETFVEPSFDDPPPAHVPMWSGTELPKSPPSLDSYMGCQPCDCGPNDTLIPWRAAHGLNSRAYARLRTARAPYPVAIVTGFHRSSFIANQRLEAAIELIEQGWVAALVVSGGHQQTGDNQARFLWREALRVATDAGVDLTDRIFVEPCSSQIATQLRNSLRLMAAHHLPFGLYVTDSKLSGEAVLLHNGLEDLVANDLRCPVGRFSYMLGQGPLPRLGAHHNGCQPPLSWKSNPVTVLLPFQSPSVFWVSPTSNIDGTEHTTLECRGGSPDVIRLEPDDRSATSGECLPMGGRIHEAEKLRCAQRFDDS